MDEQTSYGYDPANRPDRAPARSCTCRPSAYDGDDGEDYDCPEHGRASGDG